MTKSREMAVSDGMSPAGDLFFGCDIGGTKVHSVVATAQGLVLAETHEITTPEGGDALIGQVLRHLAKLTSEAGTVVAAGVGLPGAVHPVKGHLTTAPHLAGLGGCDLRAVLSTALKMPVGVGNDVTLAAMGEGWLGEGQGVRSFAFLGLGTGVGIGLVEEGRPLIGERGAAGEIGDLPISVSDGGVARLEDLVSTRALLADYLSSGGRIGGTLRDIFAAGAGDPIFAGVLDRLVGHIALALRAVVALTDPERIILGGGIGSRPEVCARLQALMPVPNILPSSLGPRAGALGAVRLALTMAR